MKRIIMKTESIGDLIIELYEDKSPITVKTLLENLPIEARALKWGGEIFFEVPFFLEVKENQKEVMDPGEVAYWALGKSICIFYGPTPASFKDEIRAVEPVNVIGRVVGDPKELAKIRIGEKVVLTS